MTPIKRPNYFKGQLLKAEDFIAEQEYHMQMRRLHNSTMHTWGVVAGLEVTADALEIKVSSGRAIDSDGKEIWLAEENRFPANQITADGSYYIVIVYKDVPDTPYPPDESKYIRKVETGELRCVAITQTSGALSWVAITPRPASASSPATPSASAGPVETKPPDDASLLKLARVSVSGGRLTAQSGSTPNPDNSVRRIASSRIPRGSNLGNNDLTISLDGKIGIGTTAPMTRLQVGNGAGGGRVSIFSDSGAAGQLRIGNPTDGTNAEATIGFLTGVAANGLSDPVTATNQWYMGAGAYGLGGNKFTLGWINTALVTVQSNGNVGIGTTSPNSRLSIRNDTQPAETNAAGTPAIRALAVMGGKGGNTTGSGKAGLGAEIQLKAGDGGDATNTGGTNGDGSSIWLSPGNAGSGVGKAGKVGNVILAPFGGNVGIGTTEPKGLLSITEATGTVAGGNQGTIIIDHENSGGASSIVFRSKGNPGSDYGYIQYQDDSTVGGTGESSLFIIGVENDNADHLILKPSGNVGIGTVTPDTNYKLDVAGRVKATGFKGSGSEVTEINANNITTGRLSADRLPDTIPRGIIAMWSGASNAIPAGWTLCDGSNGTPDLRDRFIVAAGRKYAVGNIGGADEVTLTVHQMPSHNHNDSNFDRLLRMSTGGSNTTGNMDVTVGEPVLHESRVIKAAGSDQPHENRPPYYALAFIMKL